MRAVVCTGYGPPEVLQVRDIETPTPGHREVRIKVRATAVTSSDCIIRSFDLPASMWLPARLALGLTRPRKGVLGMVLAGEIDAAGKDVTTFEEGDEVFAFDRFGFGAYAQYKCMPATGVLTYKPARRTYEEAAAIPYGAMLALHFLRKGEIRSGQRVLVYGASGAVGTAAVQLAKHFGAEVTAVCSSRNEDLVRSLGADAVIDYTKEDATRPREPFDLFFVAVGNRVRPPSRSDCRRALAPKGAYVSVDQGRPEILAEDLVFLNELVEAGKLEPVIDRCYPLEQMVEAHRYVDQGHKRGNVVISVAH